MALKKTRKRSQSSEYDPMQIKYIATDMIFPNPSQPRIRFDQKNLIRLADSIKRYGIIQPLTVKKLNVDFKQYISEFEQKNVGIDEKSENTDDPRTSAILQEEDSNKPLTDVSDSGESGYNALEEAFKIIAKESEDEQACSETVISENAYNDADSEHTDGKPCKKTEKVQKGAENHASNDSLNGISYILRGNVLTKCDEKEPFYELVSGERRLRAARMLGMPYVPCIISEIDKKSSAEIAMVENLIRQDLNMFEEANAIERLINSYNMTQEQVAKRLSMSQSAVANKLRLLRLTPTEQNLICEYSLSERHARALLKIEDPKKRIDAINKIYTSKMNVAAAEQYIDLLIADFSKQSSDNPNLGSQIPQYNSKSMQMTMNRAIDIIKSSNLNVNIKINETDSSVFYTIEFPKIDVSRET